MELEDLDLISSAFTVLFPGLLFEGLAPSGIQITPSEWADHGSLDTGVLLGSYKACCFRGI